MQVHARARRFRKCVTITLPPDLVETARQKRINISRIAEIALKQTLGVEESHELATNGGNWLLSEGAGTGNFVSRDFEPGSRDPQSRRLTATPSRPPLKIDLFPIYFCFQNLHLLLNALAEPLSRAKPKPTPDTRNS